MAILNFLTKRLNNKVSCRSSESTFNNILNNDNQDDYAAALLWKYWWLFTFSSIEPCPPSLSWDNFFMYKNTEYRAIWKLLKILYLSKVWISCRIWQRKWWHRSWIDPQLGQKSLRPWRGLRTHCYWGGEYLHHM